jgi:cysteinyl-tRNA synthetase
VIPSERIAARIEAAALPTREAIGAVEVTHALDVEAIEALSAARQAARKARDFAFGDAIRDHLKRGGVVIEDTGPGRELEAGVSGAVRSTRRRRSNRSRPRSPPAPPSRAR